MSGTQLYVLNSSSPELSEQRFANGSGLTTNASSWHQLQQAEHRRSVTNSASNCLLAALLKYLPAHGLPIRLRSLRLHRAGPSSTSWSAIGTGDVNTRALPYQPSSPSPLSSMLWWQKIQSDSRCASITACDLVACHSVDCD